MTTPDSARRRNSLSEHRLAAWETKSHQCTRDSGGRSLNRDLYLKRRRPQRSFLSGRRALRFATAEEAHFSSAHCSRRIDRVLSEAMSSRVGDLWLACAAFVVNLMLSSGQVQQTQQVSTSYGIVTGNLMDAPMTALTTKFQVYAFRGIRYAKPPLGRLRFQVSSWNR